MVGMFVVDDVAISMGQVVMSGCGLDDDSTVVGVGPFEKGDGVGVSIISSDMKEVVDSIHHLHCLLIHRVAGVINVEGSINIS